MKKLIIAAAVAFSLVAGVASAQTYGSCVSISTTLSIGSRGSQVLALQQYLVSQDYPGSGTWMETGYYGQATTAAVRDFQESRGLPQTGAVDSITLSALQNCNSTAAETSGYQNYSYPGYPGYTSSSYPYGTTYPYNYSYPYSTTNPYGSNAPTITSLSQNTGVPGQTVTIYGQGFSPYANTVYFSGEAVSAISTGSATSLTFTIPYVASYGTEQTVQLYVTDQYGTSNTVSFTLNPSECGTYGCSTCGTTYPYSYGYSTNCGCTNTYAYTSNCSTCGYSYSTYPYSEGCQGNTNAPTITYLSPQSGGVGTDVTVYGSGFTTSNNTVHFGNGIITGLQSPDGQSVSFTVPSTITGYGSQPLTLGTYEVSVTNSNNVTTTAVPFDVTSTSNGTSPTITGVSGPSNVQTGVQNTWMVTVNNPNSSYADVSVSWGDSGNGFVDEAAPQVVYGGIQTISFSHAYETAGTYTLTFTIGNPNGQQNSYTETITVSGSGVNGSTPSISYLSPQSGYVGTGVTIYGSNLSYSSNSYISFGGGAITGASWNGNSITFTVPSSVGPYCAPGTACPQYLQEITPGTYNISVTDEYGTSNELSFTVL